MIDKNHINHIIHEYFSRDNVLINHQIDSYNDLIDNILPEIISKVFPIKINIKKSKTDQVGIGMIKAIPYFENTKFCPVVSLKEWINYAKINSGRIFKISDKSVALIIKKYALISGLDHSKYAGHSLRSGFATSTAETGADERSIMAMTGHKTTQMVRRYIKEANIFKNNALNRIKI